MIGSFLTGALALVLGYAYPAYECFKTVELNKPEIDQLRFWCQYWILVAALTLFERVGDAFVSWLPMYSEAKVAFFIYLWYPKTRGTAYVYETFFRPCIAKHETEIDRNLLELRARAGDMVVIYSQRIVSYGQTRIFDVLQFIASQSPSQSSRPRPAQPPRQQPQQTRPTIPTTAARQPPRSSSLPASPQKKNPIVELPKAGSLPSGAPQSPARTQSSVNSTMLPSSSETTTSSTSLVEVESKQVLLAKSASPTEPTPPPPETPMEEAIRVTRGRLRKRAATASP